jgi:hypothetical protein
MSATLSPSTVTTAELVYATSAGMVEVMRHDDAVVAYVLGVTAGADFQTVLDAARDLGFNGRSNLEDIFEDGSECWVIYPER